MNEKSNNKYLFYAEIFFCMFVFLKQFYLLPSGSIGIGDAFLIFSAIIVFVISIIIKRKQYYIPTIYTGMHL